MKNEEKILTMLEGLTSTVTKQGTALDKLTSTVEGLSSTVTKQGAALDKLVGKVDKLETDVAKLQQGQDRLETDVAKLQQGQDRLEEIIIETKESVVLIENDHGKKIGALFDAQSRIHDIAKEILTKVNRIDARLDRHDIEIVDLYLKRARAGRVMRAKNR